MPWIRILGELPQPVQYKLMDETEPWQFTATYEGSFGYTPRAGGEEPSGLGAYAAALKDNYVQLVFLDGATSIGRDLIPQMEEFGFKTTSVVNTPYTAHKWTIWQRHDDIPEEVAVLAKPSQPAQREPPGGAPFVPVNDRSEPE